MNKLNIRTLSRLRPFLRLWSTQSLSQLGSASTSFALSLWLYEETGAALSSALLSVCAYLPYVAAGIFAGALADRWDKKRTMLVCDLLAALVTVTVYVLLTSGRLAVWHLYLLTAINGLMNTVQQPASEVAMTQLIPVDLYQKSSGLRAFSQSLISVFHPLLASGLYAFGGLTPVMILDLGSCLAAMVTLLLGIRLPGEVRTGENRDTALQVREGLDFLRNAPLVLDLILFLAGVNLVASAFDAVLPAFVLSRPQGGAQVLGIVSSAAGAAMLAGSGAALLLPPPRDRVRVIWLTMLISLGTESFLLAFSQTPALWCLGQVLGWLPVPVMNANLDVILRTAIPADLQGRVYACRNAIQFCTIPLGLVLGGAMVDHLLEPWMSCQGAESLLVRLFGSGQGAGAALAFFLLGIAGIALCLAARNRLGRARFEELCKQSDHLSSSRKE